MREEGVAGTAPPPVREGDCSAATGSQWTLGLQLLHSAAASSYPWRPGSCRGQSLTVLQCRPLHSDAVSHWKEVLDGQGRSQWPPCPPD